MRRWRHAHVTWAPEAAILLPELINMMAIIRPPSRIDPRTRDPYHLPVAVSRRPFLTTLVVSGGGGGLIAGFHHGQILQVVQIVQVRHMLLLLLHHLR